MAKTIVRKKNVSIHGVLNIDAATGKIVIEAENGEAYELDAVLDEFNGSEVAISVGESVELA